MIANVVGGSRSYIASTGYLAALQELGEFLCFLLFIYLLINCHYLQIY